MNYFYAMLKNPYKILSWAITGNIVGRLLPDKAYLSIKYRSAFGKRLDWNNPTTFNEKLQWLKLYDRKSIYTKMVDKYEVKKYVANLIGDEYIIPTLGVWDKFEEIDFDKLPSQFVLKCTHDSGGLVICKDKNAFDVEMARKKINRCLKNNFYWLGREWPYKNVKPRIIAEKYLEDCSTGDVKDYKFFCFGGIAKCMKIDFDRFKDHHANYFDMDGNILPFGEIYCPPDPSRVIKLPENYSKMIALSEMLSTNQLFLRTDFYNCDGDIYFGELTFFPMSGFGVFTDEKWDDILGEWIELPESYGGGYVLINNDFGLRLNQRIVELPDYKIHCFQGKAKLILVCQNRFSQPGLTEDFYDINWDHLSLSRPKHGNSKVVGKRPDQLHEMVLLAEKISKDLSFARIDFYIANDKVFFGEITFFPAGGFESFMPEDWDCRLGDLLSIP